MSRKVTARRTGETKVIGGVELPVEVLTVRSAEAVHVGLALGRKVSLTETLDLMHLTHSRSTQAGAQAGSHDVMDDAGEVLFTGTAHEVWGWLRDMLQSEVESAEAAAGWDASR